MVNIIIDKDISLDEVNSQESLEESIQQVLNAREKVKKMMSQGEVDIIFAALEKANNSNLTCKGVAKKYSLDQSRIEKVLPIVKAAITSEIGFGGMNCTCLIEQPDKSWRLTVDHEMNAIVETAMLLDRLGVGIK